MPHGRSTSFDRSLFFHGLEKQVLDFQFVQFSLDSLTSANQDSVLLSPFVLNNLIK